MTQYTSRFSTSGRTPARAGGTCVVETWKGGSGDITSPGLPLSYFDFRSTLGDKFLLTAKVSNEPEFTALVQADSAIVKELLLLLHSVNKRCASVLRMTFRNQGGRYFLKVQGVDDDVTAYELRAPLTISYSTLTSVGDRPTVA